MTTDTPSSPDSAPGGVVRMLPGPFLRRVCVRTATGFRWGESLRSGADAYLGAAALRLLAEAVGRTSAGPSAALPTLLDPGSSIYPEVPVAVLLSDVVITPDGCAKRWVRGTFRQLGGFLGRLHSIAPPVGADLPVRHRPAWLEARPEAAEGIGRARDGLLRSGSASAELAARNGERAHTGSACTVVHGRLSTASCVPGSTPRVLGWREAGLGDPMADLAYLLRDLVQAAAATGGTADKAACAAEAAAGYQEARGGPLTAAESDRLATATAWCVLDHLALRVWAASDLNGATALLEQTDRALPEVLAATGFREEAAI